jgi:prepilin-type N-terminal cleavage/methylation domain-containing protein
MGQAKRTQHQQYNFCQRKKISQLKINNNQSTIFNRQLTIINQQSTINSRSAFTLVELIVAISLAAMIMVITAIIFKQASSAFSQSDARSEVYQNVRTAFDIIKRDISGATLNTNYELFKSFDNIDAGDYSAGIKAKEGSDILTLLSSTPNLEDKPMALITYFLNTSNILSKAEITGTSTLNSPIAGFNPNDATGYQLGFNVSTLQFRYQDTDGTWGDTWDSTTKKYLPDAVEVAMTISDMRNRYTGTSTNIISIP